MALDSVKAGPRIAGAEAGGTAGAAHALRARAVALLHALTPATLGRRIGAELTAEGERCFLWLPVLLALGIGAYFALPVEPPLWLAALLAVAALGLLLAGRAAPGARIALTVLAMPLLGLACATVRTAEVAAPVLARPVGPTEVSGRIVDLDRLDDGFRVVLDQVSIAGLPAAETPARVRVRLRPAAEAPAGGERIAVRARLSPPPPPSLPDGFDFQRFAYFQQLGAVGFALGPARQLEEAEPSGFEVVVARLRAAIERRVEAALGGEAEAEKVRAAVAIALVTGKRGGIPEAVNDTMRDSGLAHVLAISGHHISLIAAMVFFVVRGGIALIPALALRLPAKKIAALAGFAVALGYLFLSGNTVPTQRAVVMLGVVALAVLFDRTALTLRTTALAALLVLLATPENLVGASFQLSFAAVVALIAAYEAWTRRARARDPGLPDVSPLWRGARWVAVFIVGVVATTAIASIATAPFAIYNFERLPLYGIVGNLLAMPVVSLWIMPWALLGLVLMPLGLESLALVPMGWGIDAFVAAARMVAGWEDAALPVTGMTGGGIALFALGGCWLLFWRRPWRWAGLAAVAAACTVPLLDRPPAVLIAENGRLVALSHAASGTLWVTNPRSGKFLLGVWEQRLGRPEVKPWPKRGGTAGGRIECDAGRCRITEGPHRLVFLRRPDAAAEACRDSDVLISAAVLPWKLKFRGECRGVLVLDRIALRRGGVHTLRFDDGRMAVRTVRDSRGQRPWVAGGTRRPTPISTRPRAGRVASGAGG